MADDSKVARFDHPKARSNLGWPTLATLPVIGHFVKYLADSGLAHLISSSI